MKHLIQQTQAFINRPKHQLLALQTAAMLSVLHFSFSCLMWGMMLYGEVRRLGESHSKRTADLSGFFPMIVPVALLIVFVFVLRQSKYNIKNATRLFAFTIACAFALFVYDVKHDNYQMSGEDLKGGPRFYYYFTWPMYHG